MKMLRITLEGKTYEVGVELLDEVVHQSASAPAVVHQAASVAISAPTVQAPVAGCTPVLCPMAGLVFKSLVKPGDLVTLNQVVIVLDAMKMETPVCSPVAGKVRTVLVKEGDAVDEGHLLLQIEG